MRFNTRSTLSARSAKPISRDSRFVVVFRAQLALLAVAALLLPAGAALAKEGQRFGLEGRFIEFDQAKSLIKVKVVKTKVSGGAGTGAVAGKPAPSSIRPGQDIDFAVVPEGSVLKRTVIKNLQGGGLDTTGTMEGFLKALAMVPTDKNVIFSFEKAKTKGGPEWDLRIIQLRMTEEEQEERIKQLEAAAAEADAKAAAGGGK